MSVSGTQQREVGFMGADGRIVRIPAEVAGAACAAAQSFAPLETGGLLLGTYTAHRSVLTIAEALPPPHDSLHGRSSFLRGTSGLEGVIAEARRRDEDIFVVGEWHTHPGESPAPSGIDHRGMRWFAWRGLYGCLNPVLLILGGEMDVESSWSATEYRRWARPATLPRAW